MISFINGKLVDIYKNTIVVETSGVGFDINFPMSSMASLPAIGENIKIYTYMNVREDEMSLYGFLCREDKEMFMKLLSVNGVGPKGAQNIISTLGLDTLENAIKHNDDKLISSVQGIGAKTASKICIELSDKVGKKSTVVERGKVSELREEVIEALKKLGYKENKAREILSKVSIDENMTTGDILKKALS